MSKIVLQRIIKEHNEKTTFLNYVLEDNVVFFTGNSSRVVIERQIIGIIINNTLYTRALSINSLIGKLENDPENTYIIKSIYGTAFEHLIK